MHETRQEFLIRATDVRTDSLGSKVQFSGEPRPEPARHDAAWNNKGYWSDEELNEVG